MNPWNTIWAFKTARFAVTLDWQWEDSPDLSWDETGETTEKLKSGEWGNYCFRVRVTLDGREVAADYLGNSIYANPAEFGQSHRDSNPDNRNTLAQRARNRCVGHYFPDMLHNAIGEARKALHNVPRVRAA